MRKGTGETAHPGFRRHVEGSGWGDGGGGGVGRTPQQGRPGGAYQGSCVYMAWGPAEEELSSPQCFGGLVLGGKTHGFSSFEM